jgi:anti-sigma regulatory factor (Ser/Thr protein kinase)
MATDTRSLLDASNYAATKQQVSMAKNWVRETAKKLVDDETLYDLSLCADEIVDNARKHGRVDDVISVALYVSDDTVRLEVTNDSLGVSVPHVTENLLTVEGHGMMIVDALAMRWGKDETSDPDQLVWCEFPRKKS